MFNFGKDPDKVAYVEFGTEQGQKVVRTGTISRGEVRGVAATGQVQDDSGVQTTVIQGK